MLSRVLFKLTPKILPQTQKATFLGLSSLFHKNFSTLEGESIQFPRENINVPLNWALAKYLVTPYKNVSLNSVSSGSSDSNRTHIVSVGVDINANQFHDIHRRVAKSLSKSDSLYVEDGVLEGINVRVLTASQSQAQSARAVLGQASDKSANVHAAILLGEDEAIKNATVVDVNRGLVLSGSANKESLEEALRLITKKKEE